MAAIPFMPLYVADYLADAAHLSTLEHGAYLLLIMTYWQRGEALPDDDKKLARITRLEPRTWTKIKPSICDFFEVSDGKLLHSRVERELANVRAKSLKKRAGGLARAKQMHSSCTARAQLSDTDTETEVNTNVLTAKRRGVIACRPAEISDSLWGDWQRHRKAPFTETALKGFEREAAKAGWSFERAITEAIERGWQGFKADWVKEKNNGNDGRNKNTSGAMGVTERAARQALHEISGGVGRFDEGRGSDAALFIGQGHPAIDAQLNAMRSVGYAGG